MAKKNKTSALTIILSIVISLIVLFPVYWMFLVSVKSESDLFSRPYDFFVRTLNFTGYITNFHNANFFNWIKNSIIVASLSVIINVVASTMCAYGLSRFKKRANGFVLTCSIATQMIVPSMIVAPVYLLLNSMNLINSHIGLSIIEAAFELGFSTSILKAFFDNVPIQMDEAAKLEGCGDFRIFFKIVMPLSIPSVISVLLISFFDVYNEYLFSSTLITNTEKWLGPAGIASNTSRVGANWTVTLSQTVLFSLFPLVLYFTLQRFIVNGLTTGAVKG